MNEQQQMSWNSALERAINIVETYRVSVGNSPAGEIAARMTMDNLSEIRDELRSLIKW